MILADTEPLYALLTLMAYIFALFGALYAMRAHHNVEALTKRVTALEEQLHK